MSGLVLNKGNFLLQMLSPWLRLISLYATRWVAAFGYYGIIQLSSQLSAKDRAAHSSLGTAGGGEGCGQGWEGISKGLQKAGM